MPEHPDVVSEAIGLSSFGPAGAVGPAGGVVRGPRGRTHEVHKRRERVLPAELLADAPNVGAGIRYECLVKSTRSRAFSSASTSCAGTTIPRP